VNDLKGVGFANYERSPIEQNRLAVARSDEARRSTEALTRILLSCGEASGDLYAGALVDALRRREPDVDVFGPWRRSLRGSRWEVDRDYHALSVTGLTEALSVVPRSFTMLRKLAKTAREQKPHALVVIDFPISTSG
jgi:lipid-A-disaccharide synthase